jgi:hypothetical protein
MKKIPVVLILHHSRKKKPTSRCLHQKSWYKMYFLSEIQGELIAGF